MPSTAKRHDLGVLDALVRALSGSVALEQVLRIALDAVADSLGLDTGWVWLLDGDTGAARLAATRNLPPGLLAHPELLDGPCHCLNSFRAGGLRTAENIAIVRCSRLAQLVEGAAGLRGHATVPLAAGDRRLGLFNVATRDWRELSPAELELLHAVGALVSLAVERTRLAAQEAELAALGERNRLAREIHDTLAQSLAAIVMQLETADALADDETSGARLGAAIRRALALSRATLDEARRSVLDLRAAPLDARTLAGALRDLADGLRTADRPLDVAVEWHGPEGGLPAAVEAGLYRIAREATANVVLHAGVTRARLVVERSAERVAVRVEDAGRGFDPDRVAPGHFGLVGMRERARLLGGTLVVRSGADEGTVVEVDVPLRGEARR